MGTIILLPVERIPLLCEGKIGARPGLLPAFSLRSSTGFGSGFSPYRQVGHLTPHDGCAYCSRLH